MKDEARIASCDDGTQVSGEDLRVSELTALSLIHGLELMLEGPIAASTGNWVERPA